MRLTIFDDFQAFSAEHFIALAVCFGIILILFFTRKYFIKYRYLDLAMRLLFGIMLIGSEIGLRSLYLPKTNPESVLMNFPIPLCGHLLWLAGIACFSDSERIYRKIYPLTLLGATLSLIVIGGIPHFPAYRTFQYFFCHAGFLTAALYFVFTRKINKFGWKDFGWSCLLLGIMGGVMALFTACGVEDHYMIIHPIPETQPIYDALGQFGYTILFMLSATTLMAIFTLITWLCTRKRTDDMEFKPSFRRNKTMDLIAKKYTKRIRSLTVIIGVTALAYMLACQHFSLNLAFAVIITIYIFLLLGLIIFNEILHNYENNIIDDEEIK